MVRKPLGKLSKGNLLQLKLSCSRNQQPTNRKVTIKFNQPSNKPKTKKWKGLKNIQSEKLRPIISNSWYTELCGQNNMTMQKKINPKLKEEKINNKRTNGEKTFKRIDTTIEKQKVVHR